MDKKIRMTLLFNLFINFELQLFIYKVYAMGNNF